jgi:hypothetical protein
VLPSCEFEGGAAQAGRRYLEFAELMDRGFAAGAGCPPGAEGDPAACVTVCRDAWAAPILGLIKSKLAYADYFSPFCLDAPVACLVDGDRPCNTLEELDNPANYDARYSLRCTDSPDSSNDCDPRVVALLNPQQDCHLVLDAAEWCPQVHGVRCDFGFPSGSELHLSFTPGEPLR